MSVMLQILLTASAWAPVVSAPNGGGLVVNEIMIEPLFAVSTGMGQWVELYNNSGDWINLSEWTLENEKGQVISFSTILIAPEGYFVVGASAIEEENGHYTPDAVWSNFSLSTQGSLLLEDERADDQEFFSWNAAWDLYPGASLERVNPGWSANDRESWCHSVEAYGNGDLGTPGVQNSVYSDGFGQNTWAFIKAFVH
jgi:hypothetical protein